MASVAVDAGPDGLRAALQETTALGVHLEDVALRSGLDSIVTWRLEPEGRGTRMLMEHSGFDLTSPSSRWPTAAWAAGGARPSSRRC